MKVDAAVKECLFEEVSRGNKLTGSFEVLSGGMHDIDATIRGPNDQEMWAVRQRSQAHFHVVAAQDGLHSICFENRLSSRAVKTVAFSIHVGDDVFKELAQHEHLTPLEQEISQLADNLQTVVDEQHYYWSRERRHRDTSESTNARVLWFSVAETLVILAMAGWQFWSLRAFISKTLTF
ncbi:hypothetical protein FNF27_08017 [Cafeteria roenbergensis]|nr:hypothetical protein FNF28_06014 [Cafeteria roenbergensis]KAA0159473.1 hypothetical protein FNF31_04839 [Cafeteria roenbergensis]KAA0162800.1 hypothetical protein FNF27_08017 [Cafeteria roenbergensis]